MLPWVVEYQLTKLIIDQCAVNMSPYSVLSALLGDTHYIADSRNCVVAIQCMLIICGYIVCILLCHTSAPPRNSVIFHSKVKGADFVVFTIITNTWHHSGRYWPSVSTIITSTHCWKSTKTSLLRTVTVWRCTSHFPYSGLVRLSFVFNPPQLF